MKVTSLLRVFLVFAILAGIGTLAIAHFILRPHIKTIVDERQASRNNWQRELARASDLAKNLSDTRQKLASTEKTLKETRLSLVAAGEKADQQERRAGALQQNLDMARQELNETQQSLAAWEALRVPVERVAQVIKSERQIRGRTAILEQELELVRKENEQLTNVVCRMGAGPDEPPPMPGVKGAIAAVDPKWNFVVLDVGEKAGAKPRGIFMVSRDGKLLGKVKVATVHADRSIANVLAGWRLGEIMEGDQVIF